MSKIGSTRKVTPVVIVTGCLGKLGPTWMEALLEGGYSVYGIDREEAVTSSVSVIDELAVRFGDERVAIGRADVLDREQLERCEKECFDSMGVPRVVVNNAGIDKPPLQGEAYRLEEVPARNFIPMLEVNIFGAFQVAQVFGQRMIKNGGGSIINIGSLYATISPDERLYDHIECDPPFLKPPAYGASKAALHNITRYLATHWARYGVRVNTLSPGGVEGGQDAKFREKFCARVPMGRMANAEDLTGPLLFLASDASRYVTGINLQVDGGYTLW